MGTRKWSDIRRSKVPADQEARATAGAAALDIAVRLRDLRARRGVTQVSLAEELGISQGNVSELERRDDMFLSSLREYVEALGGRLEIAAVFDEERHPIAV